MRLSLRSKTPSLWRPADINLGTSNGLKEELERYIDEAWTKSPFILPSDPYDRGTAHFWAAYIDDKCFPLFIELRTTGEEGKAMIIEKIVEGLVMLEEVFGKVKAFFGGDSIGYLDIALGCYLRWLRVLEITVKVKLLIEAKTPKLLGWVERFCANDDVNYVLPEPAKLIENKILKFLGFMWNPLSWVMEAAAVMTIALANGGGQGPDWEDVVGIVGLLFINSTISFIEENNAGNAAAALMARLAPKTKVLRDGQWQERDAAILVPGDIISIKLGDIILADARLLEGDPLKIDQSALTGESLPVTKKTGDEVFSGSTRKAAYLVDSTKFVGHFLQVLTSIGNFCICSIAMGMHFEIIVMFAVLTSIGTFCICSIAMGMLFEIIVMFAVQHRSYRSGINNLLVLLIGGIPIAMPTGAITKRMTAIEEMAGMDVLCSDKTGTLTMNRLTVDRNLIEVLNKDMVVLLAARASRLENQDAIDTALIKMLADPKETGESRCLCTALIKMLADPKEARANITEVHFLPFNPVDKRTALTYIGSDGDWYRASKGSPEQILNLCQEKQEISAKVHAIVDKFAERGLKEVQEKSKESPGGPWTLCGLLPLFDPPRLDSAETIHRALNLGEISWQLRRRQVDDLAWEPISTPLRHYSAMTRMNMNVIEKADGFAGVFPEHRYEIVKILQEQKHVCGMTGDGVNDAPALKKADIGIAVADATAAARDAADLVLTEPGLSVIFSAVLTSRAIFQRMKNYTSPESNEISAKEIYAVSITIRIVLGFTLLALIWEYDFPPFMVLIIAILNDGTIMTISIDRVKPSPRPDSWKLNEIFATGIVIGTYLALVTILFYWAAASTTFFETHFHVKSLSGNTEEISSAIYLQVSIISQALIFVTRSQSWSFLERPVTLLMCGFVVAQLVATLIAVYANICFSPISGIGWGWAGIIWLYSLAFYVPLDIIKFLVHYALSGKAWNLLFDRKTAFTSRKDYGKEERAAKWVLSQRSLQGLMSGEFRIKRSRSSLLAEQTGRRAEIARLGELHTLRGHVESVVRRKNLDLNTIQTAHTV
ncbi:unnamed protein product [Ilex paraguariensis]|uniref:glutathione transferase n=1 Tax=Ilex paraguariensis TaxID=185542 RepID=A0ABC8T310_9AQUA